mmetsp:Transcript_13808/g.30572  ORF Transcript_13808/g.30572 Transcript_13808/m.30572 type:complete len:323 (-) Transcript_13808:367-1335(-)
MSQHRTRYSLAHYTLHVVHLFPYLLLVLLQLLRPTLSYGAHPCVDCLNIPLNILLVLFHEPSLHIAHSELQALQPAVCIAQTISQPVHLGISHRHARCYLRKLCLRSSQPLRNIHRLVHRVPALVARPSCLRRCVPSGLESLGCVRRNPAQLSDPGRGLVTSGLRLSYTVGEPQNLGANGPVSIGEPLRDSGDLLLRRACSLLQIINLQSNRVHSPLQAVQTCVSSWVQSGIQVSHTAHSVTCLLTGSGNVLLHRSAGSAGLSCRCFGCRGARRGRCCPFCCQVAGVGRSLAQPLNSGHPGVQPRELLFDTCRGTQGLHLAR